MPDDPYHYPPDLLSLLIDTIPVLVRSKRDVVLFFSGAGVPASLTQTWVEALRQDASSVHKHEIARSILTAVNEGGDRLLRARREIVKRVVEFEDFSSCWPEDRLKAEALVGRVRTAVNKKDAFTRMEMERERERHDALAVRRAEAERRAARGRALEEIRAELGALFGMKDAHARGRGLEKTLNRLFKHYGIGIREAFSISAETGATLEQVDGVIELDGEIYLVEVKWESERTDRLAVDRHVVRLHSRAEARGVVVSASGFTSAAEHAAQEALTLKVVVLIDLADIVLALEAAADLPALLRERVRSAIVDKKPYSRG